MNREELRDGAMSVTVFFLGLLLFVLPFVVAWAVAVFTIHEGVGLPSSVFVGVVVGVPAAFVCWTAWGWLWG